MFDRMVNQLSAAAATTSTSGTSTTSAQAAAAIMRFGGINAPPNQEEIPVKEEEEPLDAEILSSSPAPELSPSPETPKATPVREPDVVMEEYYKRSRRRSTRELSPITPESWRSWTWGQLKEPVWVIATYPASDSGINGNPNTMGGSFDSFRVSPQPTQLLK